MDDDGGLGIRNWGFYEPALKGNLGLQLMSSVPADRDTKPLLPNGAAFMHHHHHHHHHQHQQQPHHHHHHHHQQQQQTPPEPSVPMDFVRDGWIHPQHTHRADAKILHALPVAHGHAAQHAGTFGMLTDAHATHNVHHTIQMMQQLEPPKEESIVPALIEDPAPAVVRNEVTPLRKRGQGRPPKSDNKPRKPRKVPVPKEDGGGGVNGGSVPRGRGVKRSIGMVINGIDLDLSRIPTPVCSCTGTPQQCYRWGAGGWQSACCTTTISMHPLPMSMKRRGARIAGRKMSQGAFKKVLEKLAGEGYNLNNPIDLRTFWAKHGTNKFVTIR